MDENTFQDELRQLKQRVSEMSLSSQQRQREHLTQQQHQMYGAQEVWLSRHAPDSFSTLLASIKAQLDSMQQTVAAQVQQHQAWESSPWSPQANIALPPHGGFDAPSTPIYWQLYSSLKTDVQAIDERVAGLENLYSDLEDRLDALNPRRFTPPGSEAGIEEGNAQLASQIETAVVTGAAAEVELPADSSQQVHAESKSTGVNAAETSLSVDNIPQASTAVAFRDKEIDRLEELLKRSHDINRINDATIELREREITELEARARAAESSAKHLADTATAQATEIDRRNSTIRRLSSELRDFKASRHHFMTKYVDENYRYKWLKQKKIQGEDVLQRRIDELEQAFLNMEEGKIAEHHDEVEKLQHFCGQKDAVIYRQEEIIARGGKLIQERDADIGHLQARVDEIAKEKGLAREQNADLIHQLKKRDSAITHFRRELEYRERKQQEMEDDRRKDKDRFERASDLIRRQEAQLEKQAREVRPQAFDQAAKAASSGQNVAASTGWTPRPIPGYMRLPHEENNALLWGQGASASARHSFGSSSPMNAAAHQQRKGSHRAERRSLPVMNDASVPDKSSRATENDDLATDQANKVANAEAEEDGKPGDSRRVKHKDSSLDRKSRMNAQRVAEQYARKVGRHSLPLDATFWPPLPAPVVPAEGRRVESVPNLRGASRAAEAFHAPNGRAAIAKPASMEQLPQRRRLQAYVEEDEGGDERASSSLLD